MKLLALRVAEFGRFGDPVAIEGIGEGMNVLAGPNEMGKSTLFRALEAAFLTKHRASGAALESMRPRTGGEPLVEVDFEARGTAWRLRKQYGKSASAVLSELATGRVVARAGDAEERVAELSGRRDDQPGRLGLVWVRQRHTLDVPEIDADNGKAKSRGERQALIDVIGSEVDDAAGGDAFNAVQSLVEKRKSEFVTSARNDPKRNGPLHAALETRERLRAGLAEARRAAEAAAARLDLIGRYSAELAAMTQRQRQAATRDELRQREERIAEAAAVRAKLEVARAALRTADLEYAAAQQALKSYADAEAQHQSLLAARQEVRSLEAHIRGLVEDINADAATPARVEGALRLTQDIALAEALLEAEAARIDITLEPDHRGRVRVSGSALTQDVSLRSPAETEIAIDGIARIRVSTGSDKAKAAEARRVEANQDLTEIFAALGVSRIDDVRTRAAARTAKLDDLERARAKLSGLAPQGVPALDQSLARLHLLIAGSREAITAKIAEAGAAQERARSVHDALKSEALPDEAFRKLSSEYQQQKDGSERLQSEIGRLTLALEKTRSEQVGADEDGRAARVEGLEQELLRADAEVQRLQEEVAALSLLGSVLGGIETRARNRYFVPIANKLTPHLNRLLGPATASFGEQFSPKGLARDGGEERIDTLSDGTREQLSVLVRLSFAELLSEAGEAPPLILDDPLVYSDDLRLATMCGILGSAAGHLQVLLLTCRAHAFKSLPGRRLSVTPWRPGT